MVDIVFPDKMTPREFLEHYWQKQPLLMRNAIQDYQFPLVPEELAGLACEEGVESRLVIEHGETPWELKHGPFSDQTFARLPEDHWTLLVQDVDKYISDVADLRNAFRFIPDWRADDIMISYAEDGGSVGPHTDTYDVFLIQANGKRRWQISTNNHSNAELLPDLSVRVLKEFVPTQEWTLEPGDILYLPPGVAHWGIAEGPCMTYSMGYRAPSMQEMVDDFSQFLLDRIPDRLHYMDPPLSLQSNPGEILETNSELAARNLNSWLCNPDLQAEWFGCFVTQVKEHLSIDPLDNPLSKEEVGALLMEQDELVRHPFSRFAFARGGNGSILFFACGESYPLQAHQQPLVEALCKDNLWQTEEILKMINFSGNLELLTKLYNSGYLLIADDE